MSPEALRVAWSLVPLLAAVLAAIPARAHPGSGIVVDPQGQVFFVDTGLGVWKIDLQGRLVRHRGPAYHWMALDRRGRFAQRHMPRGVGGELPVVGPDPTLILSSDFPVTVGPDGAFYYPQPMGDDRVRLMRATPDGRPEVVATLPPATEIGPDGRARSVPWIHGLAAGPDGSLYYAEMAAVRRIAPDGAVSLVAGPIEVPGCVRPPAARDLRLGPALRGLDVAADGTVYVAASACSAVLKIAPGGTVSVVLRASDAWTPTGVAVSGDDLYVLEYRYIEAERREDWLPRVRKVSKDGAVSVVATVGPR
jgi:sugar lactone lactonase YvrE